ncbi:MAG: hypothetical protein ACQPRJ_05295 [Solitalea-like symbiont of Acarus siro]
MFIGLPLLKAKMSMVSSLGFLNVYGFFSGVSCEKAPSLDRNAFNYVCDFVGNVYGCAPDVRY